MEDEDKIVFTCNGIRELTVLERNMKYQEALKNVHRELSSLNLNRGGNNTAGFVFENLYAADQNMQSLKAGKSEFRFVRNDNRSVDIDVVDVAGKKLSKGSEEQVKMGYSGTNKYKITKARYGDQTLVVDKGNTELIEHGSKQNFKVIESRISEREAQLFTDTMKQEGKGCQAVALPGGNTAPITASLYYAAEELGYAHAAGVNAVKGGAAFAAGISFGKNMYNFIEGNMELREFILETGEETAAGAAGMYISGASGFLVSGILENTGAGAVMMQAANATMGTEIGSIIVSVGSVAASIPAVAAPTFLLGMAIGTGCAVIRSIKMGINRRKYKIAQISRVLDQALLSMKAAYDDLEQTIKDTYDFWNQSFNQGFQLMMEAVEQNDFEKFSSGLDTVVKVFDNHVLFKNMDEFDEFFFDENAVLNL